MDSDLPTMPSSKAPCDHRDMAGDSLIESKGDQHWCSSCRATWTMKPHDVVIVNDETPDTRAA
jgi:hypothetical protein